MSINLITNSPFKAPLKIRNADFRMHEIRVKAIFLPIFSIAYRPRILTVRTSKNFSGKHKFLLILIFSLKCVVEQRNSYECITFTRI